MIKFIFFIFANIVNATDCSTLASNYIKLVGKPNEVIYKEIESFFRDVDYNDEFQLIDTNKKLSIVNKIELLESSTIPQDLCINDKFISLAQLQSLISFSVLAKQSGEWLNRFQILGLKPDNRYYLLTTENSRQGSEMRLPIFNNEIELLDSITIRFYSSQILDISNIVIDASEFDDTNKIIRNFFYLISGSGMVFKKKQIENIFPYDNLDQIRLFKVSQGYIYRGVPKTGDNPSIIQIYQFDREQNSIIFYSIIDQAQMQAVMIKQPGYQFELVDFKVNRDLELAILDSQGNIIYLRQEQTIWISSLIEDRIGLPFSFDFDFLHHNYVVVLQHAVQSQNRLFSTDLDLSTYNIHFTDLYYVLSSSTNIIQLDRKLQQNSQLSGNFKLFLFDQHANDFIAIASEQRLTRYILNKFSKLKYDSVDKSYGTSILSLKECKITVDYITVASESIELLLVSKQQLITTPLFSNDYNTYQPINHLVDGPNQHVYFEPANEGKIESIIYYGDGIVTTKGNINQDATYFNLVGSDVDELLVDYFIISSGNDKILHVSYCLAISICFRFNNITKLIELNEVNTVSIVFSSSLKIAIFTPDNIEITTFNKNGLTATKHYPLAEEDKIDNIYLNTIYLLSFSRESKTIKIHWLYDINFLYQITPENIATLGITDWEPQKIFVNDIQDIIYVLNGKSTVIMIHLGYSQYYVIKSFPIKESQDLKIINWKNRFGLLQSFTNHQISLEIYNKQELSNIYYEKSISFLDFDIESLAQFFWSCYSGLINVVATKKSDNTQFVLSYLIDETGHNSLHSVYQVPEKSIFIRGVFNLIYYFNQNNSVLTYSISSQPAILSRVKFNDSTFIQDLQYKVTISNENENNISTIQNIRLANLQTAITIFQEKLNIATSFDDRNINNFVQDLGNEWYCGQVSTFSISVQEQRSTIKIINPIELISKDYFIDTQSVSELNNEAILVLQNSSFTIQKKTSEIQTKYSFDGQFSCFDILTNTNGNILLKCALQNDDVVVFGLRCGENECQLSKTFLRSSNSLLSATIHEDLFFLIYKEKVQIFQGDVLDIGNSKFYGEEDFKKLSVSQFGITVQHIYGNHYHIYCTSYYGILTILEYSIIQDKFTNNNKLSINLQEFFSEKYYYPSDTLYSCIKLINIEKGDYEFSADYLLFAVNGPHYGIHLNFICSKSDTCSVIDQSIKYIFSGYGRFTLFGFLFPKITIKQNYLIIPYAEDYNATEILTIYHIPNVTKVNQVISFFGAVYQNSPFSEFQFSYEIYSVDKQFYLVFNSQQATQLSKYKINFTPKLVLDGNIDTQTVQVLVGNDFSTSFIELKITTPDEKPQRKAIWPWVSLGLIGGCIVIGSGIYIYYKRKNQVDVQLL